ncbi:transglutaminase domain-containing protein [Clostridium sp. 'deep sea']|uniref:transglutaminase-like domain-containing protein n=1 Tax=Clostridium sp. 'deep sea' TaxID=2779445 RepID=UPI0018964A2F|nr:transglutaminase-like domain-containing protein [Clostridium sp. 'deep sea']QOR35042.1 transglutaminase domain-containing protein [Clostridium sp. 'deep sea']
MNTFISNYIKQTTYTNPHQYAYLYSDIPNDICSIVKIVNNLLIHPSKLSKYSDINVNETEIWNNEPKTVFDILKKLAKKNNTSLVNARANNEKVIVTCRGFTLLLTSILRHKGIPARARAGFAPYIVKEINIDHFICECYIKQQQRWVLLDADFLKIDFDKSEFCYVANVYLDCLSGKKDALKFGCDDNWGFSYIIMYLNLDLLCLCKAEYWYNPKTPITNKLYWSGKTSYNEATKNLSTNEKKLLFELAKLMQYCNENYSRLQDILNNDLCLLPKL